MNALPASSGLPEDLGLRRGTLLHRVAVAQLHGGPHVPEDEERLRRSLQEAHALTTCFLE